MISKNTINDLLGISCNASEDFQHIGLANSDKEKTLSFCLSEKFVHQINANANITGVITTSELESDLNGAKQVIVVDDPLWAFFTLYNGIAEANYTRVPTVIADSAKVHDSAYVSEYNVKIGENVVIGPNTSILADVEIGDGCVIGANTVLGCEDVEVKMTSHGPISVFHESKLIVEDKVSIGANTTVIKGIYGRDTVIGGNTFVSADCHISHGVQIGRHCFILNCSLSGSVTVGNRVRINPGAVISNQVKLGDGAQITLGAVVVKDVKSNEKVAGNFAIEHNRFLYNFTKTFGPIK